MSLESGPIHHRELGKRFTATGVLLGAISAFSTGEASSQTAVSPGEASSYTTQEIIDNRGWAPSRFIMEAPRLVGTKGLNLPEEVAKASEKSPLAFYCEIRDLMAIPGFDGKKQALKLIDENPHAFLACAPESREIIGEDKWQEMVKTSFVRHPLAIKQHTSRELLRQIEDPSESIRVLQGITYENRDGALLLHDIVNNNLSQKEALARVKGDKRKLFTDLLKIESVPDHLGRVSVDLALRDYGLETIQAAKKTARGPDVLVESNNAAELAAIITYGESELDAPLFEVMFKGLAYKIGPENSEGKPLDTAGKKRYLDIEEMAAKFKVDVTKFPAANFLKTSSQP